MLITDLVYLETVNDNTQVMGSAGVLVDTKATASGPRTYTYGNINNNARTFPNGVTVAIGRGFSVAAGKDPNATVGLAGQGDYVVKRSYSPPNRGPVDWAYGVVVAVDYP
jgi:hypothetical protein